MANPFKEAEKAKKKAAGNPGAHKVEDEKKVPSVQPEPKVETEPQKEVPVVEKVTTPVVEEKKAPVKKQEKPEKKEKAAPKGIENLLAGKIEQKPKAKSYGFYLDEEAVAKLDKLAAMNGNCSRSMALNMLLKTVIPD